MSSSSAKERFFARNSLAVLLIAMTGRRVVVETKNESTITGRLLHCDGYGNMWLGTSKLQTVAGKKVQFDEIHIKATSVRYVHLPDDVDSLQAIRTELDKKSRRTNEMPPRYSKKSDS